MIVSARFAKGCWRLSCPLAGCFIDFLLSPSCWWCSGCGSCSLAEWYWQYPSRFSVLRHETWRFPEIGVPPNHPVQWGFPSRTNHSGNPPFMETTTLVSVSGHRCSSVPSPSTHCGLSQWDATSSGSEDFSCWNWVSWRWATFGAGLPWHSWKVWKGRAYECIWLALEWATLRQRMPYRFRHTFTYPPAHRQPETQKNELSHRYPNHTGM